MDVGLALERRVATPSRRPGEGSTERSFWSGGGRTWWGSQARGSLDCPQVQLLQNKGHRPTAALRPTCLEEVPWLVEAGGVPALTLLITFVPTS